MKSKIIEYEHDTICIEKYISFIKHLYKNDPRVNSYTNEIYNLLSEYNPFFKHAKIRNFMAIGENGILGHVSAIIDSRLKGVGIIGFYDSIQDINVSKLLLDNATNHLKLNKCNVIRGPINLSIWNGYRFIENLKRKPNLFDPFNKDYYPDFWKEYGFKVAERYISAVRNDFNHVIPHTKENYKSALNEGFRIRNFDKEKAESELKIVHYLSSQIFKDSWNIAEISFEEFYYIYKDIIKKADTSFCEIIEDKDSNPVGFCFSIPNPSIKKQVILKTLGILSEFQGKGLAAALLYSQHIKAKEKGFREFYYPLIRVGNNVTKFPYEGYEIITNYASFELSLD
ncbi:MAG: GNAT family N-acetyltransferase [Nanoarchaeota archaeon]|nr:GNAT family N-acetyltransferase [Nanoarchaeota archaeon]MBU1005411.1 GNAT family N-acetyltransferase [Nanoarchaeota archaeon]MBU1946949.1 GNAT family N-acetyltransferase [Nanoarchaeota archaeon]